MQLTQTLNQVMLSVKTQLTPKRTRMMVAMTRNTLVPGMVLSHDPTILAAGRINKSASDHVSIRVVQQIISMHLLTFSDLIRQKLLKIFFLTTVTCLDRSVTHGGEFLSCQWMPDTFLQGAIL